MSVSRNELLDAVRNSMFEGDDAEPYPAICNLHDLGADDTHNCLACNFAELVETLEGLARDFPKFTDEKTAKITFILWLYLKRVFGVRKVVPDIDNYLVFKFGFRYLGVALVRSRDNNDV